VLGEWSVKEKAVMWNRPTLEEQLAIEQDGPLVGKDNSVS
jgi:hypothetical protein